MSAIDIDKYVTTRAVICREILVGGRVQGVGYRPFVYRLAQQHQLRGWVRNEGAQVHIVAEGHREALRDFTAALIAQAPALARPTLLSERSHASLQLTTFSVLASDSRLAGDRHIPPDYSTCPDCLAELLNPADRRYHYPFINCTQCGPRYTLIRDLPYDRPNTTLAGFALCAACQQEYSDPRDRRFHAEPIACPVCGPRLRFIHGKQIITDPTTALSAAVTALAAGEIVALKGIGGFHLCCDAMNATAVATLRARKQRPDKPLAVMFPAGEDNELAMLQRELVPTSGQAALLRSPARPIVLIHKHPNSHLADNIAPGLNEIGAMLPYSPLHYLILQQLQHPLVTTSANLSGEPVLTEYDEVRDRLMQVTSQVLDHNRPIQRPADDAVYRIIANIPRPLRLGRGNAPLELTLPFSLAQPLLACGGHLKNTVALAWENRIVLSPHIGELSAPRSQMVFANVITDLQRLYNIAPNILVCDAHPDYASTRWAKRQNKTLLPIWHHHAHAAVLAGEFPQEARWLVFTWDGVGAGADGSLWGGEALLGQPGQWQRAAHWQPFYLPGGEKAAREPWRSALALCWQSNQHWSAAPHDVELLQQAWRKRVQAPATTATGRLFDAAAALVDLCQHASFEGQGPMWLEALAEHGNAAAVTIPLTTHPRTGAIEMNWRPLVTMLLNERVSKTDRAYAFHLSLATVMRDVAVHLQQKHGDFAVGLCGGVFQNKLLSELALRLFHDAGLRAYLPERIPVNDGGLCYGQIIEAAQRVTK
jgi:hydrogenase maturation protein HypF